MDSKMNKEQRDNFALVLMKAKGEDRSINEFAKKSGVSSAHISRFLRSMVSGTPSYITIKKFADVAYNGVTEAELINASASLSLSEIPCGNISSKFTRREQQQLFNKIIKLREEDYELVSNILSRLTD